MTGFVSLPPAGPAQPPSLPDVVDFDGWWPAIGFAVLRAEVRITGDQTDTRLRAACIAAMLSVADDLAAWRLLHEAAGAASMADVASPAIGGETRLTSLWRRAVTSLVKADLDETARSPDATRHGDLLAIERFDAGVADHRRNARFAIRDILGVTRNTCELI